MWTLNIKSSSGAYFCFRCGSKGSWYDFKNQLMGVEAIEPISQHLNSNVAMRNIPNIIQEAIENPKLASEALHYLNF